MPHKPFPKGNKLGGRPKGAVNRSTEMIKKTIARAVDRQMDLLQSDLDNIRKTNPAKALEISLRLMEYVLPKMRALDIQGDLQHQHTIEKIVVEIHGNKG